MYVFGDGVVAIEYEDGKKDVMDIGYTSGAPYYVSYLQDRERDASYNALGGALTIDRHHFVKKDGRYDLKSHGSTIHIPDHLNSFWSSTCFKVENYKSITLMSDGFTSFEDAEQKSIPTIDIVNRATAFKNTNGVFLQRRMKTMMRKLGKEDVDHYDDISIATVVR